MNNGNVFQQLIAATFPVGGYQMHWLELIGILIGAASAYLGMKRWVWAWPVGILANVMLFFVYLGALVGTPAVRPGRAADLLHRHEPLRVVAVERVQAGSWRRQRRTGDHPAVGDES